MSQSGGEVMSIAPYYKVSIQQQPSLMYLKSYRAENFSYNFRVTHGKILEFSYIQEGTLTEVDANGTRTYAPGTFFTVRTDQPRRHYSDSPVYHVFEASLRFWGEIVPMTEEDVRHWLPQDNEVIVATRITDTKTVGELEKHLKQAIHCYHKSPHDRFLQVRIAMMELFQVMTNYSIRQAHQNGRSGEKQNAYCRQACIYVAEHLSKPIRESAVANRLGITTNYLSKVFSASMGMTLMEYVQRVKIQHVAQKIVDCDYSLSEAAEAVGIESTKYLSRLFRKHMGMSVTQYKKLYQQETRQL